MPPEPPVARLQTALGLVLHPHPCDDRPWNYLPVVLMLAFVARAAVALSGEFVLHPDEIMQYLEPAHHLAFGHGVRYWEYFYGARSWILPGAIAGVLRLFDAVGLGQPFWYVGGVKLAFCAVSLLVPAGMYFFGRRHFGESTARIALVAGALWYELVRFAHKPMTEFVAAAPLLALLALCVRPSVDGNRTACLAAFLVGRQDPAFAAYRYLARAPGVRSVWHLGRIYFQTPGYYYLHRRIPLYDTPAGRSLIPDVGALHASISHIVSDNPKRSFPGYSVEQAFGQLRILRRDDNELPVRQWHAYSPIVVSDFERHVLRRMDPYGPVPPTNAGIRFTRPLPPPDGPEIR